MNNKELIEKLSERLGVTKKVATEMLSASTAAIVDSVNEDRSITLQGFGVLEVRRKQDRMIFNPATGRQMIVPPKLVLTFRPSDTYREKINTK